MESVVKLNRKLGVGGRGVVYEGYDRATGRFVAVKETAYMEPSLAGREDEDTELQEILSELSCMRSAQHPNLVHYYGARRSAIGVQIIMEYVSGGSLDYVLARCGPLREEVARSYTRDVLCALQYLHEEMHVCHRDVKPANILITPEGQCKLADFGVAKHLETVGSSSHPHGTTPGAAARVTTEANEASPVRAGYLRTAVGTPWYMAPEVISGGVDDEDESDEGAATDGSWCDAEFADHHVKYGCTSRSSGDRSGSRSFSDTDERNARNSSGHRRGGSPPSVPLYDPSGNYYNPLKKVVREGRLPPRPVGYTTRADIWSVGVTVYEMLTGTRPFGADLRNPSAVLFRIANCATTPPRLPPDVAASPTLQNFLDLCFVYDKELRATATELLGHPWLRTHSHASTSPQAPGTEPASSAPSVRRSHITEGHGTPSQPQRRTATHDSRLFAERLVQQPATTEQHGQHVQRHPLPPLRHGVFDGVSLLDALDLPPCLAVPSVGSLASPLVPSNDKYHPNAPRRPPLNSGVDPSSPLRSPLLSASTAQVSPTEQTEATLRYAAARQRIGHSRSAVSTALSSVAMPVIQSASGGGLQTTHGAFVDLLSHP